MERHSEGNAPTEGINRATVHTAKEGPPVNHTGSACRPCLTLFHMERKRWTMDRGDDFLGSRAGLPDPSSPSDCLKLLYTYSFLGHLEMWVVVLQVGTGPLTSCLYQLEATMKLAACYMLCCQILVILKVAQALQPHLLSAISISVMTTGSNWHPAPPVFCRPVRECPHSLMSSLPYSFHYGWLTHQQLGAVTESRPRGPVAQAHTDFHVSRQNSPTLSSSTNEFLPYTHTFVRARALLLGILKYWNPKIRTNVIHPTWFPSIHTHFFFSGITDTLRTHRWRQKHKVYLSLLYTQLTFKSLSWIVVRKAQVLRRNNSSQINLSYLKYV